MLKVREKCKDVLWWRKKRKEDGEEKSKEKKTTKQTNIKSQLIAETEEKGVLVVKKCK